MSCFKVLVHVSSALISASKAEYGLWPSSNHLNKYKKLLGADNQAIAEEPQSWNHVHVPKAYCKHEGRFIDVQDSPNPSKAATLGVAGPKGACSKPQALQLLLRHFQSSHQKALGVRGCTVGKPQHRHSWRGKLESWAASGQQGSPAGPCPTVFPYSLSGNEVRS